MKAAILLMTVLSPILSKVSALEMSSDLSSDHASYDGDLLRLEGNVFLNHDLGTMEAALAVLKKGEPSLEFSTIELSEKVSIEFEEKGSLFSDKAFLDFQTLKGTVISQGYPAHFRGKDLDLFSTAIDLTFRKESSSLALDTLHAKENVHLDYLKDFHLDCDNATFSNETLIASSKSMTTPCHLSHIDGEIDAPKMTFDFDTELLLFDYPKGKISSFFPSSDSHEPCQFASNLLTWDHQNDLLTLKGGVVIHDPAVGTLFGENIFSLQQKSDMGKKVIQSIETYGKTILATDDHQTLTSYGTMKLDREELKMSCTSDDQKQLIYENQEVSLHADRASIEYTLIGMKLKPHVIYLDGNVKIFSRSENRPLKKGIADHIIYDPKTGEKRLLADSPNHVLFWDDEKNLKLSAPEIVISIDPVEKTERVEGVGTVRFTFTEEEGKLFEKTLKEIP